MKKAVKKYDSGKTRTLSDFRECHSVFNIDTGYYDEHSDIYSPFIQAVFDN